jgi:glycosyltransferase involved in cell wall biosynthesis
MHVLKPALSVVVPLYNKRETIAACLGSVARQTVGDFEVVVVDDGSTDGSAEIAWAFDDARIRVVSQANGGVSAARNRGIAEARAELVALIDADDEWEPDHLAALSELAAKFPEAGMYATGVRRVDGRGPRADVFATLPEETGLIEDFFAAPEEGVPVAPSSIAIRKSVIAAVGGFPEGEPTGEDLDMWVRIALRYPVACTRAVSATYRTDEGDRGLLRLRLKTPYPPLVRTLRSLLADGSVDPRRTAALRRYADWHAMAFLRWLLELDVPAAKKLLLDERFDTFRFRAEAAVLRMAVRILPPRAVWELRWRPGQLFRRLGTALDGERMTKTGKLVSWRRLRRT